MERKSREGFGHPFNRWRIVCYNALSQGVQHAQVERIPILRGIFGRSSCWAARPRALLLYYHLPECYCTTSAATLPPPRMDIGRCIDHCCLNGLRNLRNLSQLSQVTQSLNLVSIFLQSLGDLQFFLKVGKHICFLTVSPSFPAVGKLRDFSGCDAIIRVKMNDMSRNRKV